MDIGDILETTWCFPRVAATALILTSDDAESFVSYAAKLANVATNQVDEIVDIAGYFKTLKLAITIVANFMMEKKWNKSDNEIFKAMEKMRMEYNNARMSFEHNYQRHAVFMIFAAVSSAFTYRVPFKYYCLSLAVAVKSITHSQTTTQRPWYWEWLCLLAHAGFKTEDYRQNPEVTTDEILLCLEPLASSGTGVGTSFFRNAIRQAFDKLRTHEYNLSNVIRYVDFCHLMAQTIGFIAIEYRSFVEVASRQRFERASEYRLMLREAVAKVVRRDAEIQLYLDCAQVQTTVMTTIVHVLDHVRSCGSSMPSIEELSSQQVEEIETFRSTPIEQILETLGESESATEDTKPSKPKKSKNKKKKSKTKNGMIENNIDDSSSAVSEICCESDTVADSLTSRENLLIDYDDVVCSWTALRDPEPWQTVTQKHRHKTNCAKDSEKPPPIEVVACDTKPMETMKVAYEFSLFANPIDFGQRPKNFWSQLCTWSDSLVPWTSVVSC